MGFFGRKQKDIPPHPRQEPSIDLPLTLDNIEAVFQGSMDFAKREIAIGGDPHQLATLCYINGMVKMERVSEYIMRPMVQDKGLSSCATLKDLKKRIETGALYNLILEERTTMDQVVSDLIVGFCVMLFPGESAVLSFFAGTEEKRAISPPENEPPLKGPKDAFVESIRTNTSLVRRRLRTPKLQIKELLVGRQTVTPVDLLWIDGLTNLDTVASVEHRLDNIDIDGLISTGHLEEYIVDSLHTPFPMLAYTERPDRFTAGVLEGRVGILVDGLPLGWLAPSTIGQFFKTPQDKSQNWMLSSFLTVLRYLSMVLTLFLPALYIAAVTFHPELLPTRLAQSIIAAKQDVPFTTVFEVLIMLLSFELIQEAGLRLPKSIGQTVSILGGLVVGSAAVEARIVSPVVLIVVATAGIAGYTMPSQDLAGALRLWRFILAICASIGGLFGVVAGGAVLVCHLAGLESFGVAYLSPFADNAEEQVEGHTVLRQPLPKTKLREAALKTKNRRNQK